MSKILKSKGDKVERGEAIGLSGKSGRVTGPHLHFSLSWRGEFFDPAPLLK
jgi:murein DD-endopeptidase MepM/ murein hydrolase activator NlpD